MIMKNKHLICEVILSHTGVKLSPAVRQPSHVTLLTLDVTRPPAALMPPEHRSTARPVTNSSNTLGVGLPPTDSRSLTRRSSNPTTEQQEQLPIVDQDQRQATSQHKRIAR
jgi:hypothetical protein